ncbi:CDT1-like protein a, chloroplastic [Ananas comosus]|uniref:CDT1-like protein a, chloroplastic n=1 Tax=Ananas comosus TaxID=4615 RepID=A0A199V261_ANACO|nr:CDT1-like protein a, chloroplastic [Ananas comosus]
MEHESSEENTPGQVRSRKVLPGMLVENDSVPADIQTMEVDMQDSGSNIESPTPEKPESRRKANLDSSLPRKLLMKDFEFVNSHVAAVRRSTLLSSDDNSSSSGSSQGITHLQDKSLKEKSIELPEKLQTLITLFNRMESSIRLLRLCKKLPTFRNICTQVEVLSKRKFLSSQLAQMKYLFPEAIQINKILVHDEKTLCMIPDMKITLMMNVVENRQTEGSISMALCQAFQEKVSSFFIAHQEDQGTDIPEAMLPEPFNSGSFRNTLLEGSSAELPLPNSGDLASLNASHLPPSFRRLISQKVMATKTQRTRILASPALSESLCNDGEHIETRSPQKQDDHGSFSNIHIPATTLCTPAKVDSNLEKVIIETPAQQMPKRPVPTPDRKLVAEDEEELSEARLTTPARRSLIYSPSKTDGNMEEPVHQAVATKGSLLGEETSGLLTKSLPVEPDTVAGIFEEGNVSQVSIEKCVEKQACLPSIFDTICLITCSSNCSLITKQELVHKIISNNLEIEETGEVEEQLVMLERLAPDWICKKAVASGEFLYRQVF